MKIVSFDGNAFNGAGQIQQQALVTSPDARANTHSFCAHPADEQAILCFIAECRELTRRPHGIGRNFHQAHKAGEG